MTHALASLAHHSKSPKPTLSGHKNGDKANYGQKKERGGHGNGQNHGIVCKGARVSARSDDDGIRFDPLRSRGGGVRWLPDHGYDHRIAADHSRRQTLRNEGKPLKGGGTNPSATQIQL